MLLKNEGILPLKANQRVALIGPLADDAKDMLGSWSAMGEPKDVTTLRKSLQERLGANLMYTKGSEITETPTKTDQAEIQNAVKLAQQADVAVLALGESGFEMTGEAASRTELGLPGRQQELLKAVSKPASQLC